MKQVCELPAPEQGKMGREEPLACGESLPQLPRHRSDASAHRLVLWHAAAAAARGRRLLLLLPGLRRRRSASAALRPPAPQLLSQPPGCSVGHQQGVGARTGGQHTGGCRQATALAAGLGHALTAAPPRRQRRQPARTPRLLPAAVGRAGRRAAAPPRRLCRGGRRCAALCGLRRGRAPLLAGKGLQALHNLQRRGAPAGAGLQALQNQVPHSSGALLRHPGRQGGQRARVGQGRGRGGSSAGHAGRSMGQSAVGSRRPLPFAPQQAAAEPGQRQAATGCPLACIKCPRRTPHRRSRSWPRTGRSPLQISCKAGRRRGGGGMGRGAASRRMEERGGVESCLLAWGSVAVRASQAIALPGPNPCRSDATHKFGDSAAVAYPHHDSIRVAVGSKGGRRERGEAAMHGWVGSKAVSGRRWKMAQQQGAGRTLVTTPRSRGNSASSSNGSAAWQPSPAHMSAFSEHRSPHSISGAALRRHRRRRASDEGRRGSAAGGMPGCCLRAPRARPLPHPQQLVAAQQQAAAADACSARHPRPLPHQLLLLLPLDPHPHPLPRSSPTPPGLTRPACPPRR